MDATVIFIFIFIFIVICALIVIWIIKWIASSTHAHAAPQQPKALQNGMFIPKGRLPNNPSMVNQMPMSPLSPMKMMAGGRSPTYDFAGRGKDTTLTGATCFLTGMPRLTCTCTDCKEERRSK